MSFDWGLVALALVVGVGVGVVAVAAVAAVVADYLNSRKEAKEEKE